MEGWEQVFWPQWLLWVTYTCDKHIYYECILYKYMKPFLTTLLLTLTATVITMCMRSCAVHMGECLHTMLRMCASFFVYQNWMDEAKSAGRPED